MGALASAGNEDGERTLGHLRQTGLVDQVFAHRKSGFDGFASGQPLCGLIKAGGYGMREACEKINRLTRNGIGLMKNDGHPG